MNDPHAICATETDRRPGTLTLNCRSCYFLGTGYGGCRLAWEQGIRANCPYWQAAKGDEDDGQEN